jgi:hypothetical protein
MAGGALIAICAAMVPGPVIGETARGLIAIAAVVFIVSRKSHLYYRPELPGGSLPGPGKNAGPFPAR